MIPTKNEASHIPAALQKAEHDQLIIKTAIRERLAVVISSFRIYRLSNPYETLDPTLITINNEIPSLASLWPSIKSRDTNTNYKTPTEQESKHRRKEMMRLNESLLDLPEVLINSIKLNHNSKTKIQEFISRFWCWILKHHMLSMQQAKEIFKEKEGAENENDKVNIKIDEDQVEQIPQKSKFVVTIFEDRDVLEVSDTTITGILCVKDDRSAEDDRDGEDDRGGGVNRCGTPLIALGN
ncbi:11536_t:CDS:2 [Ambispora leptoticha]|uniref:11536_t:CDS:1 n=1 Tax=Ambispora leptoticha TaxID=144679 RepID=A0A9N9CWM3_9GLOM|nr:11536_t:CDS:2 [Ambispora leptoticha]